MKKDHVVQKHGGIQLERHLRPSCGQRGSGLLQNVKFAGINISVMQRCETAFMPGTKSASCSQGLTFNPRVELGASEGTQESSDLCFSGVGMGGGWAAGCGEEDSRRTSARAARSRMWGAGCPHPRLGLSPARRDGHGHHTPPLGALCQYWFVCSTRPPRDVSTAVSATSQVRKLRHREARS